MAPEVAVTVTVKFFGCGGALLPPPQATGRTAARTTKRQSSHIHWRFLFGLVARMQPMKPSGNNAAESPPPRLAAGGVARAAESAAAFIVNVAVPPAPTELGEMPHIGMGAGPFTEHAREIVPEKPPWARDVSVSLACPPRLSV